MSKCFFKTFAHKGKKSKILKETYNFKIDLWRIPSLGQLAVPTATILCNMKILGSIYDPENRNQIMSNMGIFRIFARFGISDYVFVDCEP